MKKLYHSLITIIVILAILLQLSNITLADSDTINNDYDPLVDIKLTFQLLKIRSLEKMITTLTSKNI